VQRFQEDLGWGLEVQAFSRGVIVETSEVSDLGWSQSGEIGFSGQDASEPSDGVFDSAFLPRRVRVTEESLEAEALSQSVMEGELGSVIEGDGLAQLGGQGGEQRGDGIGDGAGSLVGLAPDDEGAGRAFVESENDLSISAEEHEIGLPMTGARAIGGDDGAQGNGDAIFDVLGRASATTAAEAALALATRQIEPPGVVFGAGDLSGDEAIDRLMADDDAAMLAGEPSRNLLWRPATRQARENQGLELGLAQQLAAAPPPRFGSLLGEARLIADFVAAVALQLTSDARWRAIQSCRNLPDRLPSGAPLGNLTPLFQAKVLI
jgi:hypothetical protein